MAKPKINLKKLQREYEERIAKQRKNKANWPAMVMTPTDKSIQEANDILFEGRYYKPTRKRGMKF